jgi:membrane protein CcdC involved in cytochrome C biogenesis
MDFVSQHEAPPMNLGHLILVIVLNLLVLAQVCIAMYMATADPDNFSMVFMKAFFGMLIPTLIAGFYLKRRMRSAAGPVKV